MPEEHVILFKCQLFTAALSIYLFAYVPCFVFRLRVFSEGELVVDTGYLIDKTLKGGKIGLYVFSQSNVVWSNMSYKCNGR